MDEERITDILDQKWAKEADRTPPPELLPINDEERLAQYDWPEAWMVPNEGPEPIPHEVEMDDYETA